MDVEEARAKYLVDLVSRYSGKDSRILEVGCREGANLVALWQSGFTDLTGVESETGKVSLFTESHPDIAERVNVKTGSIDDLVHGAADKSFDMVFTVGFLFDKTGDYSWLFPELARIAGRYLISIEEETSGSPKGVIEGRGFKEVEAKDLSAIRELESVFFVRVFERAS
jgi:hypothetical protein